MQTVPTHKKLTREDSHPPSYDRQDSGVYDRQSSKTLISPFKDKGIEMPDGNFSLPSTKGNKKGIAITVSLLLLTVIAIACLVDSYHKINEGYVGIYFRHGALQDRVTQPGVHLMRPFFDDFTEVLIRPETHLMEPVTAITKDGILNTFKEINVITLVREGKLVFMAKKFGIDFKRSLVFDRI